MGCRANPHGMTTRGAPQCTTTARDFGRLDCLFNCSGGSLANDAPITEVDLDEYEQTLPLDLEGTTLSCRHGIPQLIRAGCPLSIRRHSSRPRAATECTSNSSLWSSARDLIQTM